MLTAALTGFGIGFSLILAIGAQNAFVLRQGLVRQHVFVVALICALSDSILIAVGVAGIGALGVAVPWAIPALNWGGVAFLIFYGALSMRRAFEHESLRAAKAGAETLRAAVVTCLALTWLNPHVYLDTVALIGAIATSFDGIAAKTAFGAGAASASFFFFFSLGYGAQLLGPFFARPRAWTILDGAIALVMWGIAASLVLGTGMIGG
jgi:L-lysine exporter family protein LysE/ArgO